MKTNPAYVYIEDFQYPSEVQLAVTFTTDFDAQLLRKIKNEPTMEATRVHPAPSFPSGGTMAALKVSSNASRYGRITFSTPHAQANCELFRFMV